MTVSALVLDIGQLLLQARKEPLLHLSRQAQREMLEMPIDRITGVEYPKLGQTETIASVAGIGTRQLGGP